MDWFTTLLIWYFFLFAIGIIFAPIAKKLFGQFYDIGYPFAKTIGIIILSYTIFVLGIIKVIPFTRESLFFILILFAVLFYTKVSKFRWEDVTKQSYKKLFLIIFSEILFFLSLIFLTYVRGQEPSIHGLEKFMDFGFIQSILRSNYFPPLDMWYSADSIQPQGYAINYYYFGHLSGAVLIKLSNVSPFVGYNLILATIFAQGITMAFSICANLVYLFQKHILKDQNPRLLFIVLFGLLGSYILNLGGNLHPVYLLTNGYEAEKPVPFWGTDTKGADMLQTWEQIKETQTRDGIGFLDALSRNSKYWYPNATRFIPYTIHEFPSYSYVVADLHGHVFDIPFVLVTIALIIHFFIQKTIPLFLSHNQKKKKQTEIEHEKLPHWSNKLHSPIVEHALKEIYKYQSLVSIIFGFLIAVHYMTNAFDGPIYVLFIGGIFLLLYGLSVQLFIQMGLVVLAFVVFSYPFSSNFSPFVSGIGVNCSPDFLVNLKKLGPFLFEKGNCQISAWWMLVVLWGFFWLTAILHLIVLFVSQMKKKLVNTITPFDLLMLVFFGFGTFLVIIPEFFYIKDIYPAHFRANTMFKMGYQAFMLMSIASAYVLYRIKVWDHVGKYALKVIYFVFFAFVFIYPFLAFPSYYPNLTDTRTIDKTPQLDGLKWIENVSNISQDREIIEYINNNIVGQPVILEAQGDSYTDYERISANTGVPTIAGWWVHEWLWRGDANVVGKRIPDIVTIYESPDVQITRELLAKYNVEYVVISRLEREKYPTLHEAKFSQLGTKIFETKNGFGALYKVK